MDHEKEVENIIGKYTKGIEWMLSDGALAPKQEDVLTKEQTLRSLVELVEASYYEGRNNMVDYYSEDMKEITDPMEVIDALESIIR